MSEDKKKILFIGPKNPVLEEIRPQLEGTGLFGIHETTFKEHNAKEILIYADSINYDDDVTMIITAVVSLFLPGFYYCSNTGTDFK